MPADSFHIGNQALIFFIRPGDSLGGFVTLSGLLLQYRKFFFCPLGEMETRSNWVVSVTMDSHTSNIGASSSNSCNFSLSSLVKMADEDAFRSAVFCLASDSVSVSFFMIMTLAGCTVG